MSAFPATSRPAAVPGFGGARLPVASSLRVLAVIPTLNEERHIQRLLEALSHDLPVFASLTIVVVDGGSRDGTVALVNQFRARHPEVVLLDNPARVQSAGVNAAVRRYGRHADVLIRCDAHALYPSGYCRRLVESLQKTGADAIVVPMDSVGAETSWHRAVARVSNSRIGTGGSAHRAGRKSGFVDHGHHAAFRVETFVKTGGYDESFSHNEDAEFDCRQRLLGARIYLDGDIRVGYEPRSSVRALWKQYFAYGAGRSRTIRRHPRSARLRQLAVPVHLVLSVVALALSPWFPVLLAWPASYLAVLAFTSVWFSLRLRSVGFLWSGVAAAIMHVAWACGFLRALITSREPTWSPQRVVPLVAEGLDQG
jgi:succinoglycan biosynthesis protein ExoA